MTKGSHLYNSHPFWVGEPGQKARTMYGDGKTVNQIAIEIGAPVEAVAGFIAHNERLAIKELEAETAAAIAKRVALKTR